MKWFPRKTGIIKSKWVLSEMKRITQCCPVERARVTLLLQSDVLVPTRLLPSCQRSLDPCACWNLCLWNYLIFKDHWWFGHKYFFTRFLRHRLSSRLRALQWFLSLAGWEIFYGSAHLNAFLKYLCITLFGRRFEGETWLSFRNYETSFKWLFRYSRKVSPAAWRAFLTASLMIINWNWRDVFAPFAKVFYLLWVQFIPIHKSIHQSFSLLSLSLLLKNIVFQKLFFCYFHHIVVF